MSTGSIPERTFIAELKKSSVQLTRGDEDILLMQYAAAERGNVDYRRFLEDLKNIKIAEQATLKNYSLTEEQDKLVKQVAGWLDKKQMGSKLVQELKRKDRLGKGYISEQELTEACRAIGL